MHTPIYTDRLILREIRESDYEGMFALDSDPKVHKYLGNNPIQSVEQAKEIILFVRQQYVENGIGRWAVIEKKTNEFVGWTGLKLEKTLTNGHDNYYDLGYRLRPEFWGKGIGFEAALPFIYYGFEKLGIDKICGAADVDNLASNKILKKCGLKFIESFHYDGVPCNWYELNKAK
ncbi:MAG: GNAT family N-acetyltransferase [Salibacteraceae bacterium]